MSVTLKTAIGVYYQEDLIDIEVVTKTFSEEQFLGNLALTGTARKDPVLTRMEVQGFFEKLKVVPEGALLALGPDQVAFRHLSLPPEAEENLDQAIQLQLMNFVPSELEDFCIEKIIQQGKEKTIEVDLYIIPREKLLKIVEFLKSLGITVGGVTLTAFGLEGFINRRGKPPCPYTFVADLDFNHFSIYLFRDGKFSYFKLAWINPMDKNLQNVLKEVERCASLSQMEGEADIEVFVNLSDPNWEDKINPAEYPFIRHLTECSPFPARARGDMLGLAAACQALQTAEPEMNLLPAELRPKPSRLGAVLAILLGCALVVGLLLNVSLEKYTGLELKKALKAKSADLDKEYGAVLNLKRTVTEAEKKLESYRFVLKKPQSDLVVLKDLTDKINVSSYLFDYVRSDNLVIGGYTDSVLKLQGPEALGSIKYFRKIIPEGAINKIRVPGEPKDGKPTYRELESFRFNIQFADGPTK